jgi:RNA polymerase sigma factor (sigma-70 family)
MILRGRRRRPEESLSMALVKLGRAPSPVEACRIGPSESPEAIAIRNEETALLRVALEGLKPEQRQVIDLRHIQQLSTREAARYLSLTPNATKVRLHRARHALRRCYDDLSVPSTASGARCAAARRKTSSLHRRCS